MFHGGTGASPENAVLGSLLEVTKIVQIHDQNLICGRQHLCELPFLVSVAEIG